MKRLILGIFISFGAIFLMSHNANAVSKTYYLKNGVYAYGIPGLTGSQSGNSTTVQTGQQYNIDNNVYKLPGNKIWYSLAFRLNADNSNVDLSPYTDYTFSFSYCSAAPHYFIPSSNDLFRMTDYYESGGLLYYDFSALNYTQQTPQSMTGSIDPKHNCSNVTMKGKVGTARYNAFQLGTTANNSFTRIFSFERDDLSAYAGNEELYIISPTVVLFDNTNEADEAIQKEKQNIQNAADNSETSGNQSQSSSEGATSNLLSVFTGFANVITNASPTSCVINAPLNTAFSSDRLNVDLCGLDLPPAIGTLTSIIAVMVVVPFAISMFNKFIGIMQGFQR